MEADVDAALEVVFDEGLQGGAAEETGAGQRRRRDHIQKKRLELAAEPVVRGDIEADLFPLKNLRRKLAFHEALQNVLLAAPVDFQALRETCCELDDLVIEERRAHLERVRH